MPLPKHTPATLPQKTDHGRKGCASISFWEQHFRCAKAQLRSKSSRSADFTSFTDQNGRKPQQPFPFPIAQLTGSVVLALPNGAFFRSKPNGEEFVRQQTKVISIHDLGPTRLTNRSLASRRKIDLLLLDQYGVPACRSQRCRRSKSPDPNNLVRTLNHRPQPALLGRRPLAQPIRLPELFHLFTCSLSPCEKPLPR